LGQVFVEFATTKVKIGSLSVDFQIFQVFFSGIQIFRNFSYFLGVFCKIIKSNLGLLIIGRKSYCSIRAV